MRRSRVRSSLKRDFISLHRVPIVTLCFVRTMVGECMFGRSLFVALGVKTESERRLNSITVTRPKL